MPNTALQKMTDQVRGHESRDLSHQMLGAAKYATVLHQQTGSDLIRFLLMVRDEKRYLDYGCQNFDEFLDSGHSPIPQRTFYRRLELFQKEGDSYDLLEDWRVPAATRRLLTDGEFAVDGNEVVIGEQRVALSEETVIRQAIESLVRDRIATRKKLAELEGWKSKHDVLKAAIDAAADEPEYVTAFKAILQAMRVLIAEVRDLPGGMKGERGPLDLPEIYLLIEQLVDEYGEPLPWARGSWNVERPNGSEQERMAYDEDNF